MPHIFVLLFPGYKNGSLKTDMWPKGCTKNLFSDSIHYQKISLNNSASDNMKLRFLQFSNIKETLFYLFGILKVQSWTSKVYSKNRVFH